MKRLRDGSHRVTDVTEVVGMEGPVIVTQELFAFEYLDEGDDGKIVGRYKTPGLRPCTLEKARQFGFEQPFFEHAGGTFRARGIGSGRSDAAIAVRRDEGRADRRMLLAPLALVAFALRWPSFGNPAQHPDEDFYLFVGDRMLRGAFLCRHPGSQARRPVPELGCPAGGAGARLCQRRPDHVRGRAARYLGAAPAVSRAAPISPACRASPGAPPSAP